MHTKIIAIQAHWAGCIASPSGWAGTPPLCRSGMSSISATARVAGPYTPFSAGQYSESSCHWQTWDIGLGCVPSWALHWRLSERLLLSWTQTIAVAVKDCC